MGGTRRSLRRAQAWRLEPPGAATAVAGDAARRRWDEARAKAIAWAVAMANDPRVVYLDTETTGFGPRAEIVDIAVVGAAGDVLYESLVRPTRRIPWDATAVHGITDADVAGAPDWEDLYEDLVPVLEGRRIIVYNVVFDKQMVTQACSQYALAPPAADWDCAMKRYAGFYGSWDAQKRWYRFQKLEHAVLAFGAEPGGHRAAADAFACRAVVLGMAATTPPALDAATETPDPQQAWQIPAAPARTAAGPQSDDLMRWACAARDFLALLDDVPIDLHERPGACGIWSAREVAAHCAGWEWEGARRLRLLAADPAMTDGGLRRRWLQPRQRRRARPSGLDGDAGRPCAGQRRLGESGGRRGGHAPRRGVAVRPRGRLRGACRGPAPLAARCRTGGISWARGNALVGGGHGRVPLKSVTVWHRILVPESDPNNRSGPPTDGPAPPSLPGPSAFVWRAIPHQTPS